MKRLFIFLLLVCALFASSPTYGYSRLTVERAWTIGDANGSPIDFRGALAVNGTNQRVVAVITEPEMEYTQEGDGTIWLSYKGEANSSEFIIRGTAIVDVNYDTHILSDSPLPENNLSFTNLTLPDASISAKAKELTDRQSSLKTIANLVNWVHGTVEYDVGYWGEVKSAREVFQQRRGVCVEYTHLLISMARSLGFETRYTSGYVFSNSWQPHAWAEIYVPGYGWLPADATFGQVGILDSSHVVIDYGEEQPSIYDLLICQNENATLTVRDKVTSSFFSEESHPARVVMDFDEKTYVIDVIVTNNRPEYLYGSYGFVVPTSYGEKESSVVLLEPHETVRFYHGLNHSIFESGFSYNIPVSASFNDAVVEEDLSISISGDGPEAQEGEAAPPPCLASVLLIGMLLSRAVI